MNLAERRQHLFDNYIKRMFDRRSPNSEYSQERSMRWLTWLAQRMYQESQTVFLIERMQPKWLKTKLQQQIYSLGLLMIFLIVGGLIGQMLLPIKRVIFWLILIPVILAPILGVNRINPVESLKWSWKNGSRNIIRGLMLGLLFGLILKLPYELIFNPLHWQIFAPHMRNFLFYSLIRGIVFASIIGIIFGLVRGMTSPSIQTIAVANQGIWQSLKNAIVFGLIGFLMLGIAAKILNWPIFFWGTFGLSFGMVAGGGEACIKHFVLRLVLYLNGYIPWNYARFLDWGTDRIFLQKVGGGYIFVHRLLLEHFAQIELD